MNGRTTKAHLAGIGGVGMAALAVLLRNRGWTVSGCDLSQSARTRWLESLGIAVARGHDPAHVADADLVVATPALARDNAELAAAAGRVRMRGDVLAELVGDAPDSIAVCGSHGKTTTSTFVAKLLVALGEDVEWAIGGETGDFPVAGRSPNPPRRVEDNAPYQTVQLPKPLNLQASKPLNLQASKPLLVVEADESDGTLARYRARTLVVTNCEYDHPDHFKTPADYVACFDAARRQAGDVVEGEALAPLPFLSALPAFAALAPHNRRNARAAVEVALRRGHSPEAVAAALPDAVSALPDRRFQQIWPRTSKPKNPKTQKPKNLQTSKPLNLQTSTPLIFTDYAHHPTEMACAVAMARDVCRGRLRVLFQPHRHSRTKALLGDFPAAFRLADEVVLCPVYAAFEPPVEGGSSADLYAATRAAFADARAPRVFLARSCAEAWEHARNAMAADDVTLLLGAGDIVGLVPQVVADMEAAADPAARPRRRILVGQGSNTWRSDLNLDVEYAKTEGPAGEAGAALLARRPGLCPWMAGIPGTIGGWVKMNAGAFGHAISEVVEAVKVDGEWIPREACGFGYRTSAITGEIQDVRWRDAVCGEGTEADFLARRRKFPSGTKGSVFKNPPGDFAGRLLETAGAKGLRVGGAYVWEEHANVIVSGPDATASDFLALAQIMRDRVLFRLGIRLEPEVRGLEG